MEGRNNLRFIALFAFLAFLEVGIENTTAAWLATYALRSSTAGAAAAAATSSLYWCGFVAARAVFAILLLRVDAMRILRVALPAAFLCRCSPDRPSQRRRTQCGYDVPRRGLVAHISVAAGPLLRPRSSVFRLALDPGLLRIWRLSPALGHGMDFRHDRAVSAWASSPYQPPCCSSFA